MYAEIVRTPKRWPHIWRLMRERERRSQLQQLQLRTDVHWHGRMRGGPWIASFSNAMLHQLQCRRQEFFAFLPMNFNSSITPGHNYFR